MNNLKFKIFFALILFTIVTAAISIIGNVFIRKLSADSKEIIKDNYQSIEYVNNMLNAVDNMLKANLNTGPEDSLRHVITINDTIFKANLFKESNNLTEPGEKEVVLSLAGDYQNFLQAVYIFDKTGQVLQLHEEIKNELIHILNLNMTAISLKNIRADRTAGEVSLYMLIAGGVSAFLSILILLYFPNYILRPLYELTSKINEISKGNYDQKVSINSKDEIGNLASSFNLMTDKLEEYEKNNVKKLLVEKKKLESIIRYLGDAIIILDENKNIVNVNETAEKILGVTKDNLIGKYAPDVAAYNDLMREIIKDIVTESTGDNLIPVYLDNSEKFFQRETVKLSLNTGENEPHSSGGYIITLSNVTWFEKRDTAKTNLIATVSHELKTPLSSINLSLKLLEYNKVGDTNDEQKKIINSIRQQTGRLSKVVNELLDFSQIESGNIKLRKSDARPADIVEYATYSLMMLIAEKGIQLDIRTDEDLPVINIDVEKTVWVLINLITNAIRYTPENGTIIINVKKENNRVVYSVTDQGPGIPKEDFENIFNRFVQIGDGNLKGKGLGLAIAKDFVNSQEGKIWVDSEIGVGSTFYFSFPLI